jgi:two-component system response regulator GlrR
MTPPWNETVLVVDDSALYSNFVAAVVRELGIPVVEARSAVEAFGLIAAEPPALLLSDLEMPGGGGLALLEGTRAWWPGLPFVLWSASPLPAHVVERARELDAHVTQKLFGRELDRLLHLLLGSTRPEAICVSGLRERC